MEILNLEGHLNCITGSRVTAILLNGWILPIGGASAVEGLLLTGPTPSSFYSKHNLILIKSLGKNRLELSVLPFFVLSRVKQSCKFTITKPSPWFLFIRS